MLVKVTLILTLAICLHSSLWVDPNNSVLRDEYNRIRVIHGVNSVFKEFPFHPTRDGFDGNGSLVAEDFANLRRWGFNSIRLYIAWEGFEPQRHQYNYTYLSVLKEIVREAEEYGISILIDAHHDLYSRKYCGEGFPTWLGKVESFPAPFKVKLRYDKDGFPLKEDCMKMHFQSYYTTFDVVNFALDFFKNKDGMLDMFIEMWVKVVDYFKAEANVIGYDILNEPAGGNLWWNPYSYIGPSQENFRLLMPFYRKISV
jgi:endoglycosylceramidase